MKAQPKVKKPGYLDSRCSRHITGDESLFQKLDRNRSENVTFGDNSKGAIQRIGTIGYMCYITPKFIPRACVIC